MAKSTPEKIVEKLIDNFLKVDKNVSLDLLYIERVIGIYSTALFELREWVNQFNFTVKNDKVHFFKVTKPYVFSEHLLDSKLFEIESRLPVTSIQTRKNEVFGFAVAVRVIISIIIIITTPYSICRCLFD